MLRAISVFQCLFFFRSRTYVSTDLCIALQDVQAALGRKTGRPWNWSTFWFYFFMRSLLLHILLVYGCLWVMFGLEVMEIQWQSTEWKVGIIYSHGSEGLEFSSRQTCFFMLYDFFLFLCWLKGQPSVARLFRLKQWVSCFRNFILLQVFHLLFLIPSFSSSLHYLSCMLSFIFYIILFYILKMFLSICRIIFSYICFKKNQI